MAAGLVCTHEITHDMLMGEGEPELGWVDGAQDRLHDWLGSPRGGVDGRRQGTDQHGGPGQEAAPGAIRCSCEMSLHFAYACEVNHGPLL
jgi:hypothetical protein